MTTNDKPLTGLRVLVTRALGQSHEFKELLAPLGAIVSEIPVIEIREPEDFTELDQALRNLQLYNWLIFASKNAVEHTLARVERLGIQLGASPHLRIAAIGPATAGELIKRGVGVHFCPSSFMAEFLVDEFPGYPDLAGTKVLWPKTNIGRTLISDKLRQAGATVDTAIAYITGLPADHQKLAKKLVDALCAGEIDVITLASAQSAYNLADLLNKGLENRTGVKPFDVECKLLDSLPVGRQEKATEGIKKLLTSVKIAAIGPVTARTARQVLGKTDVEASQYTLAGLTEALLASLKFEQKEQ